MPQIIRRSGPAEKALILTRVRNGHRCEHAVMVIGICLWDGIQQELATELYDYVRSVLPTDGEATERRCGWNEKLVLMLFVTNASFLCHSNVIGAEASHNETWSSSYTTGDWCIT
jgi:hypothetical protein